VGRHRGKVHWDAKAIAGFSAVMLVLFLIWQIPNYVSVWPWGVNNGYRVAGLTSGHYERKFPAILRDMPQVGMVLVGGGEQLVIDYDLEIDEGKASFTVWKWPIIFNRPFHIGPKLITASGNGRIAFDPEGTGFYRIYMHGHRLQGSVAVDWQTLDAGDGARFADRDE
jgi:hypothetical protein